jgi:hypothetical protein
LAACLALVLVPAIAWAVAQPRIVRTHLVPLIPPGDLVRVGDDLWVESAMNSVELGRVEDDLVRARARVAGIFGEVRAHPTVIVVRDVAGIDRYCANDTGAAYNSPFGSFVVLGPHGYASVDVIAHELVHAEHAQRAGYLRYTLATPMWFIEGLAMQVDTRSRYDDRAWSETTDDGRNAPALESLETARGFGGGNAVARYATARRKVARWLAEAGPRGLHTLLEASLSSGSFESLYGEIGR